MKKLARTFPYIPILGILLVLVFHGKYQTGIEDFDTNATSSLAQALSVLAVGIWLVSRFSLCT